MESTSKIVKNATVSLKYPVPNLPLHSIFSEANKSYMIFSLTQNQEFLCLCLVDNDSDNGIRPVTIWLQYQKIHW